jgi:hypothetical protein
MKLRYLIALAASALLIFVGNTHSQRRKTAQRPPTATSSTLSRLRAAELIKSHPKFKETKEIGVPVGTFFYDWRNIKEDILEKSVNQLSAKELLTFRETGNTHAMWWKEYVVELTPAGETEAKNWRVA